MPRALNLLRDACEYRKQCFSDGLRKAGFSIVSELNNPGRQDLLLIWNRIGVGAQAAYRFDNIGAKVLVAENGYYGHTSNSNNKPMNREGEELFALAIGHHNGAGQPLTSEPERWIKQGLEMKPMREIAGDGISSALILGQRGIGESGIAMPRGWAQQMQVRLTAMGLKCRVREHPGRSPENATPLLTDLETVDAAVTWSSNAGLFAMMNGWPVFSSFPRWIGKYAAPDPIEEKMDDRQILDCFRDVVLEKIGQNQWTLSEISAGVPFASLRS